jgi:putative transposase
MKEAACAIFIDTLMRYRDDDAHALHAFVLMPDHFHLLLTPAVDKTVERVMQYVKGGSAHAIRQRLSFSFPVWQRGFSDHRIRDEADFEGHVGYIQRNPLRRRLAAAPEAYPWSSASGRYLLDAPP